ncbi:hypothetical protein ACQP25_28355 [Microtetraspora malaysiensis]|uniref:hypothetical protein n=1 Tax=Microtetraspora malaysiensis TaxID=161358 RepID=UPI003D8CF477
MDKDGDSTDVIPPILQRRSGDQFPRFAQPHNEWISHWRKHSRHARSVTEGLLV